MEIAEKERTTVLAAEHGFSVCYADAREAVRGCRADIAQMRRRRRAEIAHRPAAVENKSRCVREIARALPGIEHAKGACIPRAFRPTTKTIKSILL